MAWQSIAEWIGVTLAMVDVAKEFCRRLGAPAADLEQQIAKARASRSATITAAEAADWRSP